MPLVQLWSVDIIRGLGHMHACDVLHRDLKPANIILFLNEKSAVLQAKLCDFGSTRFFASSSSDAGQPMTRNVCTVWYRAPELMLERRVSPYGTEIDMWSYGCVVGELLTGRPVFAFQSGDIADLWKLICRRLGGPPASVKPSFKSFATRHAAPERDRPLWLAGDALRSPEDIPDAAKVLVEGCLAWNPKLRWTVQNAAGCGFLACPEAVPGHPPAQPPDQRSSPPEPHRPPAERASSAAAPAREEEGAAPAREKEEEQPPEIPPPQAMSGTKCACNKRCCVPMHKRYGCSREVCLADMRQGIAICDLCCCRAQGCRRRRHDHPTLCFAHKPLLDDIAPSMKKTLAFFHLWEKQYLVHLASFVAAWPVVQDDAVWQCIVSLIGEPEAVRCLVELLAEQKKQARDRCEKYYGKVCKRVCERMDKRHFPAVWASLEGGSRVGRVGVG